MKNISLLTLSLKIKGARKSSFLKGAWYIIWFMIKFTLLILLVLNGCYQIRSDDDLRTVPTTNNPNLINESKSSSPSIGY